MKPANWLHPVERRREKKRAEKMMRSITAESTRTDPQENVASAPADDEELRLHAIWLAESYPAAYTEPLLASLRVLAAGKHGTLASGAQAVAWLEDALRNGGGGWTSLGPIVRPGSDLFAHADPIEADLPAGVRYALGGIHMFVPLHALVVVCFVLDESAGRRVERLLRATYRTYGTPHGRWTSIHGPFNQKRNAVRAERRAQLEELGSFYERQVPGLFCTSAFRSTLPSIEFWTTKQTKPFDEERREVNLAAIHSFIHVLDWLPKPDAWQAVSGLTLVPSSTTEDRDRDVYALQLVARERDLFASDDMQMWGGVSRPATSTVSPTASAPFSPRGPWTARCASMSRR